MYHYKLKIKIVAKEIMPMKCVNNCSVNAINSIWRNILIDPLSSESSYVIHGEAGTVEEDAGEHINVVATGYNGQSPDNSQRPHPIRPLPFRVRQPIQSRECDAGLATKQNILKLNSLIYCFKSL